jgi:hypothetical protein
MRISGLLYACAVAAFSAAASADPVLFIHDASGNLGKVDVATGATTVIGPMGLVGDEIMTDIAFSPTGQLFGTSFTSLYSINAGTGAATLIGGLGAAGLGMNALVFRTDGVLLGAGFLSRDLFSIDVTTGAATSLGTTGYRSAGDLAFHNGHLYLSSMNDDDADGPNPGDIDSLIEIDQSTIVGTLIGPIGFSNVFGLATGDDNELYALSGTTVLVIDPTTGAGTAGPTFTGGMGESFGSSFFTEAGAELPVPEPTTLALLGWALPGWVGRGDAGRLDRRGLMAGGALPARAA